MPGVSPDGEYLAVPASTAFAQLAYDGYGHLYGVADGQLREYDLAGTYGIVNNPDRTVRLVLSTVTGIANESILATTTKGELVSYPLNPISRHSLRGRTWGVCS
jgi:hypothetical protein